MSAELESLERLIAGELEVAIHTVANLENTRLSDIQPPSTVIECAARAAAAAIITFERGYRMSGESADGPTIAPAPIDHAHAQEFDSNEPGNVERESAPVEDIKP